MFAIHTRYAPVQYIFRRRSIIMQKLEWVATIRRTLESGMPFYMRTTDENKAPVLFAADVFRRQNHDVVVRLDATASGRAVLHVTISAEPRCLEFTIRREDNLDDILNQMTDPHVLCVSVRACGTVINTVCNVVEFAIHRGWYIDKTIMNTLTQMSNMNSKQRNTTLHVVLRRGSIVQ